jgi:hypothetical protein
VLPLKPSKYTPVLCSCLAHEEVVVGLLSSMLDLSNIKESWLNIQKEKTKKIDTPPWFEIVGGHPRIRLAMVCEYARLGGVSNYIMCMINMLNINTSEPLSTCLIWKISNTLLPFVDMTYIPLKISFSISTFLLLFCKIKSSST